MLLSLNFTESEVAELQKRYYYLINYSSEDPSTPIDPLTYVDSSGDHLLHIAARAGDLRSVELLIRAGENIDQRGDMGCTALHYAIAEKQVDVVDFLLAHGADSRARNDFGQLPADSV